MKKTVILILGLSFLLLWLILGYPFEIKNLTLDRFITIIISVIIGVVILLLAQITIKLKVKVVKVTIMILIFCILICYSWIGLWTVLISFKHGPIWEDTEIYTNVNGNKVISQFRETSGSMYDYRERLIIYEFPNKNRISIDWHIKWMRGIWKIHELKTGRIYDDNFSNQK